MPDSSAYAARFVPAYVFESWRLVKSSPKWISYLFRYLVDEKCTLKISRDKPVERCIIISVNLLFLKLLRSNVAFYSPECCGFMNFFWRSDCMSTNECGELHFSKDNSKTNYRRYIGITDILCAMIEKSD